MILIQYLCPKCAATTAISDIEKIKNAEDEYPLTCHHCRERFSKDALVKFARQRAEKMIAQALSRLKKHTEQHQR